MKRRSLILGGSSAAFISCLPVRLISANNRKSSVGIIMDDIFYNYHLMPGHPESPERYRVMHETFKRTSLPDEFARPLLHAHAEEWLTSIHSEQHIQSIKKHYPEAYPVALAAVAAALSAVDEVMQKRLQRVFCATRPPGHHALNTGKEEGFCYFNQIAIAARYAQKQYGLNNILIVDWDYHHGNSTEAMFYHDPSILFFSTHDLYAYPGTGNPDKTGEGKGKGFNINVHLPCATTDEMIIEAFKARLLPLIPKFKPELVLISAGFDSKKDDRLGCFDISDAGFVKLTQMMKTIANQYCDGRIVSTLEGGYNLQGNADAVIAHIKALKDIN